MINFSLNPFRLKNKKNKNLILAISSGGGHLAEIIKTIPEKYENQVIYVTCKNGHTQKTLRYKPHYFVVDPHVNYFKYLINFIQSLVVFFKVRPQVIISTGAGIAVSILLIGYFFRRKIIYIESGARIFSPSKTGNFIYRFSDLFIIQYRTLSEYFPQSKIGSL